MRLSPAAERAVDGRLLLHRIALRRGIAVGSIKAGLPRPWPALACACRGARHLLPRPRVQWTSVPAQRSEIGGERRTREGKGFVADKAFELSDAGGEGVVVPLGARLVNGGEDGLAQGLGAVGGSGGWGTGGAGLWRT